LRDLVVPRKRQRDHDDVKVVKNSVICDAYRYRL
jgi:hypothetical protein